MLQMNRREWIAAAAGLSAGAALPLAARAQERVFAPQPGAWRSFEVTTRVEVLDAKGPTRLWLPLPSVDGEFQQSLGHQWSGNAKSARVVSDTRYGAAMLYAEFDAASPAPALSVTSGVRTRSRAVDWRQARPAREDAQTLRQWTEPTELMPTDGIVKETADKASAGKASDVEKALAIYQWVVENTFRDAKTRGCGTGDVASMLRTGNLGGKCADLNALYVALVRAAGIPARDIYGIRVAPSQFGYKSLGAGSEVITKAQHCRAEVWLEGHGWVATDPADVRKVVLEEPPGNNAIDNPKVAAARDVLFGAWEGNWLGYNMAHDLELPGSKHKVGFLMYPQAEVAGALLDCLDPDTFKYTIKAAEITA